MVYTIRTSLKWLLAGLAGITFLTVLVLAHSAAALTPLPIPDPKPGSYGIAATKTQDPPTQGASISTPSNGSSFSNSPITVNGICPDGLMVQIYNNGVMVGSVMCEGGSFSLEVSLFAGVNEITASVFDDLDQTGPVSNVITVNYTDTRFTAFGELITLTSAYGRRAAPAGNQLEWPLQLSGGSGPYAFSVSWGDASETELKSQSLAGLVNIAHTYSKAGIYQVNIRVTDVNGVSAFLQTIAVSNGEVDESATPATTDQEVREVPRILWIPALVAVILLIPAYWLGRRSQVVSLHNKMLKERDEYAEK